MFMDIAKELSVTPAQLALAWLLHLGQGIIPIPGTRRQERVNENANASAIKLNIAALQRINELARPGLARGATCRYSSPITVTQQKSSRSCFFF